MAYSDETKEKAKAMYLVQGYSLRKIARELKVNSRTITDWKVNDKWELDALHKNQLIKVVQDQLQMICRDNGMHPEEALKHLIAGIKDPVVRIQVKKIVTNKKGEPQEMIETIEEPDYEMRLKYLDKYFKLLQLDAPAGAPKDPSGINVNEGGTVNMVVQLPAKELEKKFKEKKGIK